VPHPAPSLRRLRPSCHTSPHGQGRVRAECLSKRQLSIGVDVAVPQSQSGQTLVDLECLSQRRGTLVLYHIALHIQSGQSRVDLGYGERVKGARGDGLKGARGDEYSKRFATWKERWQDIKK